MILNSSFATHIARERELEVAGVGTKVGPCHNSYRLKSKEKSGHDFTSKLWSTTPDPRVRQQKNVCAVAIGPQALQKHYLKCKTKTTVYD